MYKFVHDGMLHVLLVKKVPLAKYDCACVGGESARMSEVAGQAREVSWRDVCTRVLEMLEHELYRWTYSTRKQVQNEKRNKRGTCCSSGDPFSIARSYDG